MSNPSDASYPVHEALIPSVRLEARQYVARFAQTREEVEAVQRLRFDVFNLELHEGLDAAYTTERDVDAFDAHCHHLLVIDTTSDAVVGTYRMQTHEMADSGPGWYSATEFDFSTWPPSVLENAVELGRACIRREHRSLPVLHLLWRGIGAYLAHTERTYLFGCSSLTSQDPRDGVRMLRYFKAEGLMHPTLTVTPKPGYACTVDEPHDAVEPASPGEIPRLIRTYIRTGARICGPPALDRAFKTIDFLALFDIDALDPSARRFFGIDANP